MTFLQRILGGETRGIESPMTPLTPAEIDGLFAQPNVDSGIHVTESSSLQVSTVWRCVNVLANTAASLPLRAYREGSYEPVGSDVLKAPHPEMTPFEFWRLTYVHRLLWGNHYSEKVYDGSGRIKWLLPLDPSKVKVGRSSDGTKVFEITRTEHGHDAGRTVTAGSDKVFHLPGLGYDGKCGISPIQHAAQAIGLSMAAERHGARMFGQGTHLSGVLHTDRNLTPQQADAIKARWRAKMAGPAAAHDIAVLDNGANFTPISMPNTDAQFIESRGFQTTEICRWFGVPPHMVGNVDRSTSWGSGIEQQSIGFVVYTLRPDWLTPTEQRITRDLLRDPAVYARYSVDDLLRGDSTARANFYRTMREIGAYSVNDILADEKRPPVDGGDTRIQPMNMAPLGEPAPDGTPPEGDQ